VSARTANSTDPRPGRSAETMSACDQHLARTWLVGRLSGHLDRVRAEIAEVLTLEDDALIDAVAGRTARVLREQWVAFSPETARAEARVAGVELICRCRDAYPARLQQLANPPAVLHVAGSSSALGVIVGSEPVAIVGARSPTPYGKEMARMLARGLAAAGVPVISGMALGIDSCAHGGALERGGLTVTVLPSGADRPYPASRRGLYGQIVSRGAAVSELPPGTAPRNWCYPARNRLIAALAVATVVVEAGERSGALLTAGIADQLGRPVGAVPGRVGTAQAHGPNALLAGGARVIRGAQDVLDLLYGAGARTLPAPPREPLDPELERLRQAIAEGHDSTGALTGAGFAPDRMLAGLAALELSGHIHRQPGGRYAVIA
jgi:DNA processing protein